jgi:uncharacterized delta-60 repeat protein
VLAHRLPRTVAIGAALVGGLLVATAGPALARPAAVDASFGSSGRVGVPQPGETSVAGDLAAAPGGALVVAGSAGNTIPTEIVVARITADGLADPGFGQDGIVEISVAQLSAGTVTGDAVVVEADGRVVFGGSVVRVSGTVGYDAVVGRLTTAGDLDPTFGSGGLVFLEGSAESYGVTDLARRPTGEIVATVQTGDDFAVVQLLEDGSLDPTFGSAGPTPGRVPSGFTAPGDDRYEARSLHVAPDGTATVVAAHVAAPSPGAAGPEQVALVRFGPDGQPDPTFGAGGRSEPASVGGPITVLATAAGPSGATFIVGRDASGTRVLGIAGDGSLDPAFGTQGQGRVLKGAIGGAAIARRPSGQLVVASDVGDSYPQNEIRLWQLEADGRPDPTFGPDGLAPVDLGPGDFATSSIGPALVDDQDRLVLSGTAGVGRFSSMTVTRVHLPQPPGYWLLAADGTVHPFGAAPDLGDEPAPGAVDVVATATSRGYWVLGEHGVVRRFGDAGPVPVILSLDADERAVSLSATPTDRGLWVFTDRGRALPFGDATTFGDLSSLALNAPIIDSVATPTGQGYYLVAEDGGVFAFGDAVFRGSLGSVELNAPVRALVPTTTNEGYWLVASDGGVFAFGDAGFRGSVPGVLAPSQRLNAPVTAMVAYGDGYLVVGADGGVFTFSDLPFGGSLGGGPIASPIVSLAAT